MGVKGAILGDIAGSQYEFNSMRPKDLDWKNVPLFTDKCCRTDDSILTLATKGAILEGERKNKEPDFTKWYWTMGNNYEGGYGGMFRKWLNTTPHPYNSFGNGSAMRVSFVGEHYENPDDVINFARRSAQVTHNHPEGVKGAIVTAACASMVKFGGKGKQEIYDYACKFYGDGNKYKYPVTMSLEDMRKIYKWDVSCQGSVPAAIRCVLEADSYEEFMRNVMSLRCDMDTLGAIGGGIAEELFGLGDINVKQIFSKYLELNLAELAFE